MNADEVLGKLKLEIQSTGAWRTVRNHVVERYSRTRTSKAELRLNGNYALDEEVMAVLRPAIQKVIQKQTRTYSDAFLEECLASLLRRNSHILDSMTLGLNKIWSEHLCKCLWTAKSKQITFRGETMPVWTKSGDFGEKLKELFHNRKQFDKFSSNYQKFNLLCDLLSYSELDFGCSCSIGIAVVERLHQLPLNDIKRVYVEITNVLGSVCQTSYINTQIQRVRTLIKQHSPSLFYGVERLIPALVEQSLNDLFLNVFGLDCLLHFYDQIALFSQEGSGKSDLPSISNWITWFLCALVVVGNGSGGPDGLKLEALAEKVELKMLVDRIDRMFVNSVREQQLHRITPKHNSEIDDFDDVQSISEADFMEYETLPIVKQLQVWNRNRLNNKAKRLALLMKRWRKKVDYIRIWLRFLSILRKVVLENQTVKLVTMKSVPVEIVQPAPVAARHSVFYEQKGGDLRLSPAGMFFESLIGEVYKGFGRKIENNQRNTYEYSRLVKKEGKSGKNKLSEGARFLEMILDEIRHPSVK